MPTRSSRIQRGGGPTLGMISRRAWRRTTWQAATSGEDPAEEAGDEVVPEELGGPFVETSASEEFATGTDESNPPDAETEPLPLSGPGIVGTPKEELP